MTPEAVPSWQGMHTAALVAPSPASEYDPAGHCVHVPAPVSEYDPAGQMAHVSLEEAPTTFEAYPAAHKVHSTVPSCAEYDPALHRVHVALPLSENVPAGHMAHVDDALALTTEEA